MSALCQERTFCFWTADVPEVYHVSDNSRAFFGPYVDAWHSTEWRPIPAAGRRYVISLTGFPVRILPDWHRICVRSNISHELRELRDANFMGGNAMHWRKISAVGLFVVGLSIPAFFSAPDVARAQVIIVAPSGGHYARPLGGVRRAVRGVARAKVRRKVRRKIRKKLR